MFVVVTDKLKIDDDEKKSLSQKYAPVRLRHVRIEFDLLYCRMAYF